MNDKVSNLKVRQDRPTAISSLAHGANVDAIGFNLVFIALKNPKLAIELIKHYDQANGIKESDPKAPDEDLELFTEALKTLLSSTSSDDL